MSARHGATRDDDDGRSPKWSSSSPDVWTRPLRWRRSRSSRWAGSRCLPRSDFAGGFPAGIGAHAAATGLLATFPVEGWARECRGGRVADRRRRRPRRGPRARPTSRPPAGRSRDRCRSTMTGAAGWRSASATRCIGAIGRRYRLASSGLLLLGVRGGHVVRHRPADLDAPGPRHQGPTRGSAMATRSRSAGTTYRPFPRPQRLLEATRRPGTQRGQARSHPRSGPRRAGRPARHRAAAVAPRGCGPRRAARPARCRAVDGAGDPDARLWRRRRRSRSPTTSAGQRSRRHTACPNRPMTRPGSGSPTPGGLTGCGPRSCCTSPGGATRPRAPSYRQRGSYVSDSAVSRSAARR